MPERNTVSDSPSVLLETITALSHRFGTPDYVCGGGGNTSAKNESTLWVKPSGTTLAGLRPDLFVPISRSRLAALYTTRPPQEPSAREQLVKEVMASAVLNGAAGRPSVESPLHDSLSARYVVHTHPALVNGMTCAKDGRAVCQRLFPDALWMDYVDPGYTLCMAVRNEVERFEKAHGRQPEMIFLKNHGVFVAADNPERLEQLYQEIFRRLEAEYARAGLSTKMEPAPLPKGFDCEGAFARIRSVFGSDADGIAASGFFRPPAGPLTPDHIVYARSFPLTAEPTPEALEDYRRRCGCTPQILVWNNVVFGLGSTEKKAALALELALNGALVVHLAKAFGGVEYMSEPARRFIEGWEVETYRSRQIQ
ncbi:MAG TPA: class II aldolase/adducin family protein [Anaerohalosphaeraceae bacterium]|nr:class II aldolase/adducin family protein [Anaerohalosphaeraceae bacterium]